MIQNRHITLIRAGRICYKQGLLLQDKLVNISKVEKRNFLILCEHDPVYTFGKRQSKQDMTSEIARLSKLGAECEVTNRGGLTTFHGPGQLVCYPIINLHNFVRSAKWYVRTLEQMVINTCGKFEVSALRCEHVGIWVGQNKVAAIGVNLQGGVTKHGLALNCNNDLSWFSHITPCGVEGMGVTSLRTEVGRDVEGAERVLVEEFEKSFECEVEEEEGREEFEQAQEDAILNR